MKIENSPPRAERSPVAASSCQREELQNAEPTAEDIRTWLLAKFSELLGTSVNDIDVDEPLTSYGLGSIQAVSLTGDLEDWLGLRLPSTLLWDYSSIGALAKYLAEELLHPSERV